MNKNRKKYMQLVSDRAALLQAANDALQAGDHALYDSKMAEAMAMNQEITELQNLINETERFTNGIPHGEDVEGVDLDAMAATLRNGGQITLNQDETMNVIRTAVNESILIGTESLITPTHADTNIRDNNAGISGVLDLVTVENLQGCAEWQVPYVKTVSTAAKGTDGHAATESNPVFRVAAIKPTLIDTMAYVSRHIANLNNAAYVAKVKTLAYDALRRKVVEFLTVGDSSTFYGMLNATNTKSEAINGTYEVDANTIDEKFLRNLVMSAGGDETTGSGWLVLNKSDLIAFGDVRGTDKKPVYEITPDSATRGNTGTIKDGGLTVPYVIDSKLTALTGSSKTSSAIKTMVYGDLSAYTLGIFGDYTVEVDTSCKFAEGLLAVRGEVMAGGNLCAHEALTVVTLAANG